MLETTLEREKPREYLFSNAPIMIYGQMPRCGTNYLMDLLAKHPVVHREPAGILEFHHFMMVDGLHRYIERLKQTRHMQDLDKEQLKGCFGRAWLSYLQEYMPDKNQQMVLKESNIDNLEHFFDYFPHAQLILVVRDGRNTVPSALKSQFVAPPSLAHRLKTPQTWLKSLGAYDLATLKHKLWKRMSQTDLEIICDRWNSSALKVVNLLEEFSVQRKKQVLLVRYEDLFQNTTSELQRILNFCGLSSAEFNWDALEAMPIRGSSFQRNQTGSIDFKKGIQADSSFDPMNRWTAFSQKQQKIFWKYCREGMKALDYTQPSER